MKKLSLLALCIPFATFAKSEVDMVKQMVISDYPGSYTYGKVLDNHKVCEKATWEEFREEGIKKIIYACNLKSGRVSYTWNDNEAQRLRKNEENAFIETEVERLKHVIQSKHEEIGRLEKQIDHLKESLKITDYVKYYINAYVKYEQDKKSIDPIVPLIVVEVDKKSEIGPWTIKSMYLADLKEGFTPEDVKIFNDTNTAIRNGVHARINEKINNIKREQEIINNGIEEYTARLNNKAAIEQEAKAAGESRVGQYGMRHLIKGEEVIIWAWNPVAERYNVQYQYRRQYQYGGRTITNGLTNETLIYSAMKNITDVDEYLRIRDITPKELHWMIQENKY